MDLGQVALDGTELIDGAQNCNSGSAKVLVYSMLFLWFNEYDAAALWYPSQLSGSICVGGVTTGGAPGSVAACRVGDANTPNVKRKASGTLMY